MQEKFGRLEPLLLRRTGLRPRETCLVWLEDVFRLLECLQYSRAR